MIGTIIQKDFIEKFNSHLYINQTKNIHYIFGLIKSKGLSTNTPKVEIELKDYINLINKLNNILSEFDRVIRYNFAVYIQEELEQINLDVRVCKSCLNVMIEGYVIDGGIDYYCSEKCLECNMTLEEFEHAYGQGDTDTYYTEWY